MGIGMGWVICICVGMGLESFCICGGGRFGIILFLLKKLLRLLFIKLELIFCMGIGGRIGFDVGGLDWR